MKNTIILMGDIIKSQSFDQKYLSEELVLFRENISENCKDFLVGKVIPKVGDEFQCVCKNEVSAVMLIFEIDHYFMTRVDPDIKERDPIFSRGRSRAVRSQGRSR